MPELGGDDYIHTYCTCCWCASICFAMATCAEHHLICGLCPSDSVDKPQDEDDAMSIAVQRTELLLLA